MGKRFVVRLFTSILILLCGSTAIAKNCKNGIPCGNSCIAASKTCHIGTAPSSASALATGTPSAHLSNGTTATASTDAVLWVGSISDHVYFLGSCVAAKDIASTNRRIFSSEADAISQGYRHSGVPGC